MWTGITLQQHGNDDDYWVNCILKFWGRRKVAYSCMGVLYCCWSHANTRRTFLLRHDGKLLTLHDRGRGARGALGDRGGRAGLC